MPLPNLPYVIQTNWQQLTAWSPWEQAHANILSADDNNLLTTMDLRIRRGIYYPTISADTATIQCYDPGWHLVPEKLDSALYPSPLKGCATRILRQTGYGTNIWEPSFFGFITRVEPDLRDWSRATSFVTLTVESPLRVVGARNVTPIAIPAGGWVYTTAGANVSALTALLQAAGLWTPDMLDLEDPGAAPVPLPTAFGGQPVQFAQALSDLLYVAKAAAKAFPLFAVAAGQPDWTFQYWTPRLSVAASTFDATTLPPQLYMTPSVQWADDALVA
jgi:hypothetical protein